MFKLCAVAAVASLFSFSASAQTTEMQPHILKAIKHLQDNYSDGGYDIDKNLTHDLPYDTKFIEATDRDAPDPKPSMCVGAILEIIIHAYDFYEKSGGKIDTHAFLPRSSWSSLRPQDIKSHIWVDPKLGSFGTAHALEKFGIGEIVSFENLQKGDFMNINRPRIDGKRSKPSGHAVAFLAFLNDKGEEQATSVNAAGIKYFSHQSSTNGFGEKYAFFLKSGQWFCPPIEGKSLDCGVMFSRDQRYLNMGRLWSPEKWNATKRDSYLADLKTRLRNQSNVKGPGFLGIPSNLSEQEFEIELERLPNIMQLNPLFVNQAEE